MRLFTYDKFIYIPLDNVCKNMFTSNVLFFSEAFCLSILISN